MSRGVYGSILNMDAYKRSKKVWAIELQRSDMFWYDLIINPTTIKESSSKKDIIKQLKTYKEDVERQLEKRFIYFICSRKKVRFNVNRDYSYDLYTKALIFSVLIGREQEEMIIHFPFINSETDKTICPNLEITSKFITFIWSENKRETVSIHDFLAGSGIDFGLETSIQYVGYTKNPDIRPTNGSHEGLTKILYNISNDDQDIFIFFNLFKVMTISEDSKTQVNMTTPNSMTDEVDVNTEGLILEKTLISYFRPNYQESNLKNERAELKNKLLKLRSNHKINAIHFYYEVDDESEYWNFGSSHITKSKSHIFTIGMKNNQLEIVSGSSYFPEQNYK